MDRTFGVETKRRKDAICTRGLRNNTLQYAKPTQHYATLRQSNEEVKACAHSKQPYATVRNRKLTCTPGLRKRTQPYACYTQSYTWVRQLHTP